MGAVRKFVASHRWGSGFVAGTCCAAMVATTVAVAAIPSKASGAITACVAKKGGAVRIIDAEAGKHCRAKERQVVWSKGYRYRGAWSASASYAVLDIVTN